MINNSLDVAIHKLLDKTELFNQYFDSVFSNSDFVLQPIEELPRPQSQFKIEIFPADVFNALHSLYPSKATGCDNIRPYILKFCPSSLTPLIAQLFPSVCLLNSLPTQW